MLPLLLATTSASNFCRIEALSQLHTPPEWQSGVTA